MSTPTNSSILIWFNELAPGLSIHFSLNYPPSFFWLGLGISNGNAVDCSSVHIYDTASRYGPPASIDASPTNYTENGLASFVTLNELYPFVLKY